MTAKINIAIDDNGNYVKIQDAIKGQLYYCLNCKERLIANTGNNNIHFYRHHNTKDRDTLIECELYSSGDSDYGILLNEQFYENKVRFTIDKSLKMKMKLPYLSGSSISRMNFDNLYFFIKVQNDRIFSTDLGKRSNRSYLDVSPDYEYIIEIENERNAKLLEYEIEKSVRLFQRKALLFKKISGEYINIPYEKTNLSNDLFLLSMKQLPEHSDLILKNYSISNGIHIYQFYLQELSESIIEWFKKETGYTIVPNRKWIDLVYPNSFQYGEHSVLVETDEVLVKVTPHSGKDTLSYFNVTGQKEIVSVDENGIAQLNLERNHIYHLRLNHEICNEITLKRICEIEPATNYSANILVNSQLYEINAQGFERAYSVESESVFHVFLQDGYPYQTKVIEKQLPKAVHFPFIGTIHKRRENGRANLLNWGLLFTSMHWDVVKNSEFMDVLKMVKESKMPNRSIYIAELFKNYNKLPKEFVKIIRGGR